ncbi:DUF1801 domain-containing protein [Cellulomonas fimi]|uniref:DUF1801 domain-containing protein n=1 Tax=Cellulomonas fimi TaxID=1708 RepID=A0A7Y0QH05_CELFI|nr:DUF1801 domain-containing protein [Cellulomonas fimi]NMR19394.1 DUF1801 domain-containing protein [Cellulomonas fimi]
MSTEKKTPVMVETDVEVDAFLDQVPSEVRRRDADRLVDLMRRITGEPPRMWGRSIVGFGRYHYVYSSGREGDAPAAAFSPRKAATTVYLVEGFADQSDLLGRLGPHTTAKSCLYLKNLDAVDLGVLAELVRRSCRAVTGRDEAASGQAPDR